MKDNFGCLKYIPANWENQACKNGYVALCGHNAASGNCALYVRGINAKKRFLFYFTTVQASENIKNTYLGKVMAERLLVFI